MVWPCCVIITMLFRTGSGGERRVERDPTDRCTGSRAGADEGCHPSTWRQRRSRSAGRDGIPDLDRAGWLALEATPLIARAGRVRRPGTLLSDERGTGSCSSDRRVIYPRRRDADRGDTERGRAARKSEQARRGAAPLERGSSSSPACRNRLSQGRLSRSCEMSRVRCGRLEWFHEPRAATQSSTLDYGNERVLIDNGAWAAGRHRVRREASL